MPISCAALTMKPTNECIAAWKISYKPGSLNLKIAKRLFFAGEQVYVADKQQTTHSCNLLLIIPFQNNHLRGILSVSLFALFRTPFPSAEIF
jgi:hypothetical protein